MNAHKEAGSFRDSSGQVVYLNEKVYRLISKSFLEEFNSFIASGLYKSLADKRWLIPHQQIEEAAEILFPGIENTSDVGCVIQPEKISFITYPYEWSFCQLKQAALLTLDIQMEALRSGFSLKDASSFNIQFQGSKPIFIDSLSFEKQTEGTPWVAYRQFCQHFLAPLLLWSYGFSELHRLQELHLDGVPLKLASKLLPFRTRFNPFISIHIHYHARMEKSFSGDQEFKSRKLKLSKDRLFAILEHLRSGIAALQVKKDNTEWSDYYRTCSYQENNFAEKESTIENWLSKIRPTQTLDAGCNTGHFSFIASTYSKQVISFDKDYKAIELLFEKSVKLRKDNILPLILDFGNLSPALGWRGRERKSFIERAGKSDLILALALIHHLAIGNNIPFAEIASSFSEISTHLIIEYIPKEDSQLQKLLITKKDVFPDYTLKGFSKAFDRHFIILEEYKLSDTGRILYLMKSKDA
jgi:hypothetical protein